MTTDSSETNANVNTTTIRPDIKTGVLLLHGLTGTPAEMRPVAKYLKSIGCEVETPCLPGHGGGYKELLDTGWKDWVEGARCALDSLAARCDRVVVGGLSMGALIAVILANNNPKVDGIVCLSTTLNYDGPCVNLFNSFLRHLIPLVDLLPFLGRICYWTEEPPYGLKDERLRNIITKQIEKAKRRETNEFGLFRTYACSLRQFQFLVVEVKKQAKGVKCPALIVHSLEDSVVTVSNALEMRDMLGSEQKTLVTVNGCDHVLTLDLKKHEVAQKVGEFVGMISWQDAPELNEQKLRDLATSIA